MNQKKKRGKNISAKNQKRNQRQVKHKVENIAFHPPTTDPLSFLNKLTTLAKKVDLVSIRSNLAEINQICEQVGGVINQIGQWNRPTNYPPSQNYRQFYPTSYQQRPINPYAYPPAPQLGEKRTYQ